MSAPVTPFSPQRVPPPIPAPYLLGVPQLPDEYLTSERKELAPEKHVPSKLRQSIIEREIRSRRAAYEELHGVQIVPEPPLAF